MARDRRLNSKQWEALLVFAGDDRLTKDHLIVLLHSLIDGDAFDHLPSPNIIDPAKAAIMRDDLREWGMVRVLLDSR